jgi:hypothetical protein
MFAEHYMSARAVMYAPKRHMYILYSQWETFNSCSDLWNNIFDSNNQAVPFVCYLTACIRVKLEQICDVSKNVKPRPVPFFTNLYSASLRGLCILGAVGVIWL